jgi:hypothetical protein
MSGKKGFSGRKPKRIEEKIEIVEGYSLAHCIEIYSGTDEKKKFALTKDLTGKIIARRLKVGGNEESGPIRIVFRAARPQAESKAG